MQRSIRHPLLSWLLAAIASVPAAIAQDAPSERFRAVDAYHRPAFTFSTVDNQTLSVDAWAGKVVLIDFWASWCVPCRQEMPDFNRLRAEYADQGFEVVGIAADDLDKVREFLREVPVNFPIVYGDVDAVMQIAAQYGNDFGGLPFSAFVDRDGNVRYIQRPGLVTFEDAESVLLTLL
jgi:thiol-disulfide isomerase/thioredoxin